MLNPIFKLAKTRDEHLLIVGLLSLPGALSIDDGPADKLIAEHLALFRALPRSVDSYDEDEGPVLSCADLTRIADRMGHTPPVVRIPFDFQDG